MNPEDIFHQKQQCIAEFLRLSGLPPEGNPHLEDTPSRVVRAFAEMTDGYHTDPKTVLKPFPNEGYNEMVLVRDIEYYSLCEHHLLPFFGVAHVAYIPGEAITGLSKLPRLVDAFARRLQNQERLTQQIADTLQQELHPAGAAVYMDGIHMCMCARGVQRGRAKTVTTCFTGAFNDNPTHKQAFVAQVAAKQW